MRSIDRSYNSQSYRPKPITKIIEENIFLASACWNGNDQAKSLVSHLESNLKIQFDAEATRITQLLDGVSPLTNKLATALNLTNRYIHQTENKTEYLMANEALVIGRSNDLVSWSMIGDFNLFLKTENQIYPVALQTQIFSGHNSPLPASCIGLYDRANIVSGEFTASAQSSLFIIAKDNLNLSLLNLSSFQNLETLTQSLSQIDPEVPFWINQLLFS